MGVCCRIPIGRRISPGMLSKYNFRLTDFRWRNPVISKEGKLKQTYKTSRHNSTCLQHLYTQGLSKKKAKFKKKSIALPTT